MAVTWYDAQNNAMNSQAQIYGTISTNGGVTFQLDRLIAQRLSNVVGRPAMPASNSFQFGDYTGLDFNAGSFFAVWADNGNSTNNNPDGAGKSLDLYTAKVNVVNRPAAPALGVIGVASRTLPGQAATFTAHVTGGDGTPTGSVTFEVNGSPAAVMPLDSSGSATFTTSSLSTGTHEILVIYSGDSNYDPGDSAPSPRPSSSRASRNSPARRPPPRSRSSRAPTATSGSPRPRPTASAA